VILRALKKIEKYCIFCHNNTKFFHATAGLLYLVHIKWNTYMYLESDIAGGNFGARIMKFIVTRRPLQFPHRTEIRFYRHYHWKWMLLLLPVIQFGTIHFKTLPYKKSYIAFLVVHCSVFLQFSRSGACFSLHTCDMNAEILPPA
jgi:hypothetical protein